VGFLKKNQVGFFGSGFFTTTLYAAPVAIKFSMWPSVENVCPPLV